MSGNAWVGQHLGKDDPRLVRISPFLYSQRKLLNVFFLPKLRDLPQTGLDLKALVFDYGFNAGTSSLASMGTQKINLQIERPLMIWGITGNSSAVRQAGPGPDFAGRFRLSPPNVGFQLQLFHTHQTAQRQFFNKHARDMEICGSGQHVHLLRTPYLVIKGDQITCEVKNLTSAAMNVQVVLWGGEFD